MTRSELLLFLLLVLCLLTLPAFSGDASEAAVQLESSQVAPERVREPPATKIGSCGADFGCDVSTLGSPDSELFDHDALLEELAASLSTE